MALTQAADISFVLSGGTNNLDPNQALGGDPSNTPIINNVLNNLYDDVAPDEAEDGHEDYRCFYIFNDGETTIYAVNLFIVDDFGSGANVEIGIESRNETQRITIGGIPSDGFMEISYEGQSILSGFTADLGQWALDIQGALNALTDGTNSLLDDVIVTAEVAGSSTIFDINFTGMDGKKNHSEILVLNNQLVPAVNINVSTPQRGAPINTIAPQINSELTPPTGVSFFTASESSPITIPKLVPNDGFPIWVKRTVDPESEAVAADGFVLRLESESLSP